MTSFFSHLKETLFSFNISFVRNTWLSLNKLSSPKVTALLESFLESFQPKYAATIELNHVNLPVRSSVLILMFLNEFKF